MRFLLAILVLVCAPVVFGQTIQDLAVSPETTIKPGLAAENYRVGPEDVLSIRSAGTEELGEGNYPVDQKGFISVPLVGRLHVEGRAVNEIEQMITTGLKEYYREPLVTVVVAEYHSKFFSVLGSVMNAGPRPIHGPKTLQEAMAEVGGLKPEAGGHIVIVRRKENGLLPLPGAAWDAKGDTNSATIDLKRLIEARDSADNILIKPNDLISVPRADVIYVLGAVTKPGGFVLSERDRLSSLEALSWPAGSTRSQLQAGACAPRSQGR